MITSRNRVCFSKFVGLVRVWFFVCVHLSFISVKVKLVKRLRGREKSASGARGPRPVTVPDLMESCTLQNVVVPLASMCPGQPVPYLNTEAEKGEMWPLVMGAVRLVVVPEGDS